MQRKPSTLLGAVGTWFFRVFLYHSSGVDQPHLVVGATQRMYKKMKLLVLLAPPWLRPFDQERVSVKIGPTRMRPVRVSAENDALTPPASREQMMLRYYRGGRAHAIFPSRHW